MVKTIVRCRELNYNRGTEKHIVIKFIPFVSHLIKCIFDYINLMK